MDERVIRQIQREAADALLDAGVVVPLKAVRLPFLRKPLELSVTMKRPRLSGQIEFARTYLKMGVTSDEMWGFTKEEEMKFLAEHGKEVSRMVALTLCRGWMARRRPVVAAVSWLVRNFMEQPYLMAAVERFVSLMGTGPFTSIIRSAERTNPMRPRLSHAGKGSQGASTRAPIAPSDSSGRWRARRDGAWATS